MLGDIMSKVVGHKMIIAGIVASILFISTAAVFTINYLNLKNENRLQKENNHRLQNSISAIQREDIQELLSHIKKVLAGEIVYEIDTETGAYNPLARISFTSGRKESFPTAHSIESGLTVVEIDLNYERGEIIVAYFRRLLDSSGNLLSGEHVGVEAPSKLTVERQGGRWVVVEILHYKEWVMSE